MRKFTVLFFLLTLGLTFAQENYQVNKHITRYRLTGDNILMDNEPNIGVIGIGYDLFGLIKKYPNIYLGMNSYSALSGERAGIFSFGISAGQKTQLFNATWFADYGCFVGGGGGGGAADGGGLILRPHFEIEKKITDILSLRAGVAHLNFATGDIRSTNVNFGLTIQSDAYFIYKSNLKKTSDSNDVFHLKNFRVGLVGTLYNSFQKGPLEVGALGYTGDKVSLIGASIEKFLGDSNTFAILELNGAITGGVDGYMSYFLGIGYDYPLIKDKLYLEGRLLAGPSGGGAVATGGGASAQIEAGIGIGLFDDYELKLLGGKTYAPWGDFETQHFDIHLAKRFDLYSGTKQVKEDEYNINTNDFSFDELSFATYNRTYFSPRAKDKVGGYYDEYFNLIGFELEKKINKTISIMGSTVWAYQGSYGAYGEGWLGAQFGYDFTPKTRVNTKFMVGAGGGGDLQLGSGLLFQYNIGLEKYINNKFNFIANIGKFEPFEGNFNPVFIDLGIKLKINQLIKK